MKYHLQSAEENLEKLEKVLEDRQKRDPILQDPDGNLRILMALALGHALLALETRLSDIRDIVRNK